MMRMQQKSDAFTLIEMIIAITVFTIFIGFVMATYLTFHRAQQEAALTRSLILESEAVFSMMTDALQTNMIDYDRYASEDSSHGDLQYQLAERFYFGLLDSADSLVTDTLYLISTEGEQYAYVWDEEEGTLSVEVEDDSGVAETMFLHAENITASFVSFEIFPDVDPYADENSSDTDSAFQPIVQLNWTFSVPGRVKEEVTVDLQTSVTSRFYQ